MNKCPYCGSTEGVYKTFTGIQYYDWNGEPRGYDDELSFEKQNVYARCVKCNRRISFNRICNGNKLKN